MLQHSEFIMNVNFFYKWVLQSYLKVSIYKCLGKSDIIIIKKNIGANNDKFIKTESAFYAIMLISFVYPIPFSIQHSLLSIQKKSIRGIIEDIQMKYEYKYKQNKQTKKNE